MSREIKFRAWYKNQKVMSPGLTLDELISELSHQSYPNQLAEKRSYDVLMQYTGLIDRNDVYIYEGDVVRGLADEDWVVEWFNTGWTLRCTCHYPDGDFYELVGLEMQVIGNIYENPELLK